jgi:molybdate transport system substrate-binding protein
MGRQVSMFRWIKPVAVAIAGVSLVFGASAGDSAGLTVFAAASLRESLDEQARNFEGESGISIVVSYGASSALAKQIEAGAPADVFISADLEWMDYLDGRKLLAPGSRGNLLSNRLVLIAPASSKSTLKIEPNFGLSAALGADKLAMANPDSVPAGKYGKRALEMLGVWASVERKVARTENVRVALALVSRGEAPLGIVYATDALAERNVRVVDTFPESSHPAIVYPGAIVAASRSPSAKRFVDYLRSNSARVIWDRYGFAPTS